ncbi:MAG: 50S ribosomal protein L11 methyltransferase [Synergistales bacterium]|nr:50S ribosomal protein L11 methyltransferase [Synergistales bacterium]
MTVRESYWWYITIEGGAQDAEVLSSIVELSGSIGGEHLEGITNSRLRAYFRSSHELGHWMQQVSRAMEEWPRVKIVDMGKVENRQWHTAWKDSFPPLQVGKQLVIVPPWHDEGFHAGQIPIRINPGNAFGTGQHASTQIALELLEAEQKACTDRQVLDVGCGSGILAIAASLLGARQVTARDIDPAALEETVRNRELNGLTEAAVSTEQGDLLDDVTGPVDLLIANIIVEPLRRLAPKAPAILAGHGVMICSGVLLKERDDFLKVLADAGMEPRAERSKEEWWGVSATPAS